MTIDIKTGFADQAARLHEKTSLLSRVAGENGGLESYAGPVHMGVVGENIACHEDHMRTIASTPALKYGIHAGAAGFINLAYMAHSKAAAGLLFDINAYQTLFWNIVFEKIRACKTAKSFRESLLDIEDDIETVASERFSRTLRKVFQDKCDSNGGACIKGLPPPKLERWITSGSAEMPESAWMYDQIQYAHIRNMVLNNAIAAITLDITSRKACDQVKRFLDDSKAAIRLLYVSNILNFMEPQIRSTDFIGRPLKTDMQKAAKGNLFGWMEECGKIIECDNLEKVRPLMINSSSFKPKDVVQSPSAP